MCPSSSRTTPDRPAGDARRRELAANLADVRTRIEAACRAAGRDAHEVTMIAVTKTFPAEDVAQLAGLGVVEIGENRDQEAAPKAAEVARLGAAVRWHFVGRLQRNKARSVAGYAEMVHSVDSARLAGALGAGALGRDRPLPALIQVSVDGDPTRGGVGAGEVPWVAEAVAEQRMLRLAGVMAVAPLTWSPRAAYTRLVEIADGLRADHPAATVVSAGMSSDLDAAVFCGATHLRIGTALLGNRPPLG